MSLYFTPAIISSLFGVTRHQTKLMNEEPYRFTTRITSDDAGVTREIRCYTTAGKMLWNAFSVDNRNLDSDDLRRVCVNRSFDVSALTVYPGYNIALFDPQKTVSPAGADAVATPVNVSSNRAAMFASSQHGRMLNGNAPQPGNTMYSGFNSAMPPSAFGEGYPVQPGFFPNGPSDFPMSPQFGDFQFPHPMAPRDPNHRGLPLPHTETGRFTKMILSAEDVLLKTLGPRTQVFYHNLMSSLVGRIERPETWTGQDPLNDDLQFHSGFINTGIGAKAYAIVQAMVIRHLKKRGYDVVFYGDHDNFTVVVSIDL